jgi:hypothetical protein
MAVEDFLRLVHPQAVQWRDTLLADDRFNRLRAAAPVVTPSKGETETSDVPRDLWMTVVDLYERAERRALELLG